MSEASLAQKHSVAAPPNDPAEVTVNGSEVAVRYNGQLLFSGTIKSDGAPVYHRTQTYRTGDKVQQIILLTTMDWNKKITINGTVIGSAESFPCEADRPTDRASQSPLIVRSSYGIGLNLRNRAIYDRRWDWAFSVDANPRIMISPLKLEESENSFSLTAEGYEIILRFRPHFFQYHRGLQFFRPWMYEPWRQSVAGWISWFAFFDKVTEKDMMQTADAFSSALRPFGYEYFQMDDGYQRGNGGPELWLEPNAKFPHGLNSLASYIKSKGLKPGLWMGVGIFDDDLVRRHPDWFVRDRSQNPVKGNWIQYPLDASNQEALNGVVHPIFRGFRDQGWEYFKVDGLRHLRYEGYNANREYFDAKHIDLVDAYRKYVEAVRDELGKDHFMLGCWGIRPELVGLIDGCRIGDDGFSYAGLAQYNSFNNIVWRNDPDHIELNDDAYKSTMVTSLTGSLLMLTDKPAVYRTPVIEPAKRAAPVLFTLPGQIYDVDPSRSDLLGRVDAEVSGSGPRPFDAGYIPLCSLYSLEVHRPFGSWIVVGRTANDVNEIRFADLGLPAGREYIVFEFWTKSLKGIFADGFVPGEINPKYRCQLFCIREREGHPQLVATNRHISCGGYELHDVSWDGHSVNGISELVPGDPYTIFLYEPPGAQYKETVCDGAALVGSTNRGLLREVTIRSDEAKPVRWQIRY